MTHSTPRDPAGPPNLDRYRIRVPRIHDWYFHQTIVSGIFLAPTNRQEKLHRLLTEENIEGYLTINDIKLAAYVAHLHIFAPLMVPLEQISTILDNMAAECWTWRGSVRSATAVGLLLHKADLFFCQTWTHTFVDRIKGKENKEADDAYRIIHSPVSHFTHNFNTLLPQYKAWWLHIIPCEAKHRTLEMIHTKRSTRDCTLPLSGRIIPPKNSGRHSAPDCAYHQISREYTTQYPYFKYYQIESKQGSFTPIDTPLKSEVWINTYTPWGKYTRK